MTHDNRPTTPDETERIEQALRAMPARTRTIFMLHRLDGLSYAEIAECRGIGVNEVERHIATAMLQIDRALDGPPRPWWRWLDRWL